MRKTSVDWELVSFGGAVHSFTNPQANDPGKALYDPRAAARAFAAMRQLFSEVF
jgi:dienelactone hydrolase